MKILLIIPIFLISCTRDWKCKITSTISGHPEGTTYESLNGTGSIYIDFRGTKEEKKDYEESGTINRESTIPGGHTYYQEVTTECFPD